VLLTYPVMSQHTNYVNCVRYAPDGSRFLSVGSDQKGLLYDGATAEVLAELPAGAKVCGSMARVPCWEPAKAPMFPQSVWGSLCWELAMAPRSEPVRAPRWAPATTAFVWFSVGTPLLEFSLVGAKLRWKHQR
jgi:WD40 repeat protein